MPHLFYTSLWKHQVDTSQDPSTKPETILRVQSKGNIAKEVGEIGERKTT